MSEHEEPRPINVDESLIAMSPRTIATGLRWIVGTGISLVFSIVTSALYIGPKLEAISRMQREQWTLTMTRALVDQARILNPDEKIRWPDADSIHQRYRPTP